MTDHRVAIFGARGYIGQYFHAYCVQEGIACDLFDSPVAINECDAKLVIPCDITQASFWDDFQPGRYSGIAYFAGLSGPEKSFENAERFLEVNEKGLVYLLRRIASLGSHAPRILFPSSRLVYRGGGEVNESSEIYARSVYAANKLACEALLNAYHVRYDIPYVVLRICVPYGNPLRIAYSYGTLGFFMKCIKSGKPITVYGDGSNYKTYVHIMDLCEILKRMLDLSVPSGVFNVGGCDYSLQQVAEMLVAHYGGSISNIPWPEDAKRVEMGSISLNADKLAAVTGFSVYRKMSDYVAEV